MKKGFIPILFTSVLLLAGCGNSAPAPAPVPTLTSLTITNKDDLKADWFVGDDDREFEVTSDPAINYAREWTPSGHLRLQSADSTIIEYPGTGAYIKAKKPGTTTVSLLYYGIAYDTVEITVGTNRPEPNVKENYDLNTMFGEISNADDAKNPHQKYHGTYEIETIKRDATGYMTIKDSTKQGVVVYGSSKNFEFTWVTPGKYEYLPNPNDFADDDDLMNLEPGDTVTGTFIGLLYNNTDFELFCKIESVAKKNRPEPTSIEITEVPVEIGLPIQLEATILPADASQIIDWSVENGTGKAKISKKGLLSATKEGTVTVTAKAHAKNTIIDTWEVTVAPSSDTGLVTEPIAGGGYVMSFWKDDEHYFYTGKVASQFYGASSKIYSEATEITLEENNGKWAISHVLDGAKKYIGMHEGGGHINFKWDLTAPMYGEWNEDFNTLIFTDTPDKEKEEDPTPEPKQYILCCDTNKGSTFRAIEAENLGSDRYSAVHFHNAEPVEPETPPVEVTVAQALEIIAALEEPSSNTGKFAKGNYIVTGYVVYKQNWSDTHNNANFDIADSATETNRTKELTVLYYAVKDTFDALVKNETKVKVTCKLQKFKNKSGTIYAETNENPTVEIVTAA